MAYVTPGTVAAGDVATAAAWNVLVNNDINLRGLANVVQGTLTTATGISNSLTYVDTGLTVNITPTANTSKILITVTLSVGASAASIAGMRVMRDATAIGVGVAEGSRSITGQATYIASSGTIIVPLSYSFLDSPATTSLTTYKVQLNTIDGGTIYINRSGTDSNNTYSSRTLSSIIVREIPA